MGSLPTTYLGLPLGASHKNLAIWNLVISHIYKKLANWKWSFLSKCEGLVLLKSVLASLPTYFLSLLTKPVSVEKKIERC